MQPTLQMLLEEEFGKPHVCMYTSTYLYYDLFRPLFMYIYILHFERIF